MKMERILEIERSIIKKFRKEIWQKFVKAINDYQLISSGDRIGVNHIIKMMCQSNFITF